MARILVTGSREYKDFNKIEEALKKHGEGNVRNVLVHGDARGADRLAAKAAAELGWEIEAHPADWEKYGKRAGYVRNADMANLGADFCLAFPLGESKGTRMMINLVLKKNIPTEIFE